MKKLLNILTIVTMTSSLSSLTISCNSKSENGRIDKPTINDGILNQINANIENNPFGEFGTLTNKEIWNSSSAEIQKLILNTLNKTIAEDFYIKTMQTRAKELDNTYNPNDPTNITQLTDGFENYIQDVAANDLYQTYTKDVDNGTYLENSMYFDNDLEPDVQSSDWYVPGTTSPAFVDSNGKINTWDENYKWPIENPNNDFPANISKGNYDYDQSSTVDLTEWYKLINDNDVVNAKAQLETRFRSYIFHQLYPTVYKQALINAYLQSGSFGWSGGSDEKSLIRTYSPLFYSWQTWNNNWYSNMKMVWEIRFTKNLNSIASDTNFIDFEKKLLNSNNIDSVESAIDSFTQASSFGLKYGGKNNVGSDSIFGLPGYEGLYGITPDSDPTQPGKIFTSNSTNTDITAYTSPLTTNSQTYKPGAILNTSMTIPGSTGSAPYFVDSNGDIVIAFTLPIYLMDLIQNANIYSTTTDTNEHGISYTPYNSVVDNKVNNPISVYNSQYQSDPDLSDLSAQWRKNNPDSNKNSLNNRASYDIENLGIANNMNATQQLFALVESTIATNGMAANTSADDSGSGGTDSGIALNAEQALYSWAFNYNPDNIYSTDLYNEIGQYVQKKD